MFSLSFCVAFYLELIRKVYFKNIEGGFWVEFSHLVKLGILLIFEINFVGKFFGNVAGIFLFVYSNVWVLIRLGIDFSLLF